MKFMLPTKLLLLSIVATLHLSSCNSIEKKEERAIGFSIPILTPIIPDSIRERFCKLDTNVFVGLIDEGKKYYFEDMHGLEYEKIQIDTIRLKKLTVIIITNQK